ncbi:MAG: RNA-binding protein [Candidatus Eremiobacteraeota bacterium]|nr:RNA-binding protein [Candidatus Eremiobacteraeota bacterium]
MIRLFVAGYPRDATKEDLIALFKQFGVTDEGVVFPRDRRTRRKKGFAYVEVASDQTAHSAIQVFHQFVIDGKELTVCRAEDRPPKKPRRR